MKVKGEREDSPAGGLANSQAWPSRSQHQILQGIPGLLASPDPPGTFWTGQDVWTLIAESKLRCRTGPMSQACPGDTDWPGFPSCGMMVLKRGC